MAASLHGKLKQQTAVSTLICQNGENQCHPQDQKEETKKQKHPLNFNHESEEQERQEQPPPCKITFFFCLPSTGVAMVTILLLRSSRGKKIHTKPQQRDKIREMCYSKTNLRPTRMSSQRFDWPFTRSSHYLKEMLEGEKMSAQTMVSGGTNTREVLWGLLWLSICLQFHFISLFPFVHFSCLMTLRRKAAIVLCYVWKLLKSKHITE